MSLEAPSKWQSPPKRNAQSPKAVFKSFSLSIGDILKGRKSNECVPFEYDANDYIRTTFGQYRIVNVTGTLGQRRTAPGSTNRSSSSWKYSGSFFHKY